MLSRPEQPGPVAVRELLSVPGLELQLAAGAAGLDHEIDLPRVQRPGLALSGYLDYIRYGRVQILGGTELGYLAQLSGRERLAALRKLARCRVSCFVLTRGQPAPSTLLAEAERRGVPVLLTPRQSTPFVKQLTAYLEERLAPRLLLHGVLVDVFGLGVLLTGDSGIGKSECALELVDRGHRLVADDVVEIKRIGDGLIGTAPDMLRCLMELRGLGILNVEHVYGVSSVRITKRVELRVNLERWEEDRGYDRLGLDAQHEDVLGLDLPRVAMPVAPGRNLAMLVEVAARNRLLRERGYDAARRLTDRLDGELASGGRGRSRGAHP